MGEDEPFIDAFVEKASGIGIGDQFEKVKHYVEVGESEGGTLLCGGEQPEDQPGE